MIDKRNIFTILLGAALIGSTAAIMLGVEGIAYTVLKYRGDKAHFLIDRHKKLPKYGNQNHPERFWTLDPHLGYAHGKNEEKVKELTKQYSWIGGFLVYAKDISQIKKPVILALGGSTTDGVNFDHSWPEELAKILKERNLSGTVINGGTGGYSTNQELFKLVRDGLEFHPDIVISYSGWNDRDVYKVLPNPMVHPYQAKLFRSISKGNGDEPTYFPSTISLLRNAFKPKSDELEFTLGVPSQRTPAENYKRNMLLMHAIAVAGSAEFYGFIQPIGGLMADHSSDVVELFGQITKIPGELPFVYDATAILNGHDGVFKSEGKTPVHLTVKGDRIVAEYVFKTIEPRLAAIASAAAAPKDN